MKNKLLFMIISILFLMTGCESNHEDNIYRKDFGSYIVLNNWVESSSHSTSNKFFYVLKGEDEEEHPNNISVNVGTNRYSLEEHEKFKEAILKQLLLQVANSEDTTVNASGSNTENGYVVYTFVIEEDDVITTQYYIVGDYKYVLVHETVFGTSSETDEVAKKIVNSFKWTE